MFIGRNDIVTKILVVKTFSKVQMQLKKVELLSGLMAAKDKDVCKFEL